LWWLLVLSAGQSIVEYPTLYVCLTPLLSRFRLLVTTIEDEVNSTTDAVDKKQIDRRNNKRKTRADGDNNRIRPSKRPNLVGMEGEDPVRGDAETELEESDANSDSEEEVEVDVADDDEGYDEFMEEFVNLQNVDIEELKSLIEAEEISTRK
jgi:hypothetical protein